MIAALPMYDWPEAAEHTSHYWQVLRRAFLDHGFADPPLELTRADDPFPIWRNPALLLGQTCGLPLVTGLRGEVLLLGSPSYAIDCQPSNYCSVVIGRTGSGEIDPFLQPNLRFAYNSHGSQSGLAAWLTAVLQQNGTLPRGLIPVRTGSHRASIQAVADDGADIAAIDRVTYELACRHEPAIQNVRVLAKTPETPGLPYIAGAALVHRKDDLCSAIDDAIGNLEAETRDALLINGFRRRGENDYDGIAASWQAVQAAGLDRPFAG